MKFIINVFVFSGLLLMTQFVSGTVGSSFTACPTEAFLIQGKGSNTYGVNLATGYYSILSDDMGTTNGFNGVGFNLHDNYIYGWSYAHGTVAKVGSDYQINPIAVTNISGKNFYVGDVAVNENAYYVYRRGTGLYRIALDPTDTGYYQMVLVAGSSAVKLYIYDMAFHPTNGFAYAVDSRGDMHKIDVSSGTSTWISYVGVSGTFGAVYFDVNDNLYISRNQDGKIFRIDTNDSSPVAEEFAQGPSSSSNDGARCAIAPITSVSNTDIDFGDAPDSYGTTLDNNGARHDLTDPSLYMGALVDGESDSHVHPLSDDTAVGSDDEDGVSFTTGIELGLPAKVDVEASKPGYLNAWIDFDADGEFDDDEQISDDILVGTGNNTVLYHVPNSAASGATWARFRLSTDNGVGPTGGVSDGEVEDYAVTVSDPGTTTLYYPAQTSFVTLAYEDNWPDNGDFDMNDLVMYLRTAVIKAGNNIIRIKIEGQVIAVGAAYHSGFGIHVPGLTRAEVDEDNIIFTINNQLQNSSPLEEGMTEAVFIPTMDVFDHVSPGEAEACLYYRTQAGCGSDIQMEFSMTIPLVTAIPDNQIPNTLFDPFMFASPGFYHGSSFSSPPGRSMEVHLKNMAPTSAADVSVFSTGDDASSVDDGLYYLNYSGIPWAIEIGAQWKHPREYISIIFAYPRFDDYITSDGEDYPDWYTTDHENSSLLFVN
jgi:LruC domain-containing protein